MSEKEMEQVEAPKQDNEAAADTIENSEMSQNGHQAEESEVVEVDAESVTIESPDEAIARLEQEVAAANARADQLMEQMQRTAAEFQNVRKRQERQVQESLDRANEGIIRRLLPVLDDFELAFGNVPSALQGEEAAWIEGFGRIQQKLSNLLTDEGVKAMEKTGPFDPNRHEAVTHEPSDSVESGHIIETLRAGYEYKERVLRPALVRVAQ